MNARDVAYGYAIGYNDGIDGGASGGILRAVIDDDTSSLTIVAGDGEATESHDVYNYTYEPLEIADEIKTQIKSGDTVTTNTKQFAVKLISKLYNASGGLIFRAECNSKGKIKGFFDGSEKELYTNSFELNRDENIGISGADAPAIAWCMAKNAERSNAFSSQKKSYREGLDDSGADVTEDYTEDGSLPIEIETDPEDPAKKVTIPGITDMSSGVYYTFAAGGDEEEKPLYYLRIYKDDETGRESSPEGMSTYYYTGHLCYDIYNSFGELISSDKFGGVTEYHLWYMKSFYRGTPIGYEWVSGIEVRGDQWTIKRTWLYGDEEKIYYDSGRFPLPSNAYVVSTSGNSPF